MIAAESVADVRTFLARVCRLDPEALVRIRPAGGPGRVELWTVLPFRVLATRAARGDLNEDVTVRAAQLVDSMPDGGTPARMDLHWRGSLPGDVGVELEQIPAAECRRIGVAAGEALRQRRGGEVGDRRLRDALLDHVALRVATEDGTEHEVRFRLIVGLLRMGFATRGMVSVRSSGGRLGLAGVDGAVWNPTGKLTLL